MQFVWIVVTIRAINAINKVKKLYNYRNFISVHNCQYSSA